jgi:carboxypeptidase C (cathepsin A)
MSWLTTLCHPSDQGGRATTGRRAGASCEEPSGGHDARVARLRGHDAAQQVPAGAAAGGGEPATDAAKAAEPKDDLVTTRQVITIDGAELRYTVTAGRVVLRQEGHTDDAFDGPQAKAEVFMAAYTLDGADVRARPVTFAFNGGPGSSSVWLHLGLLGPRRVLMGDAGALLPPPYDLVDNHETLLRHSDLVFIDPVSTGYSRVVKGEKSEDFHGYGGDIESVGELIRLWTTRHGRWMSPKYMCGESYGTLRAAGLARHLQDRYGLYLNGLILISAVLDAGTLEFSGGNDDPYVMYLPTYPAIAHYHGRHGDRPLREVLDEAEAYAIVLAEAGRLLRPQPRPRRATKPRPPGLALPPPALPPAPSRGNPLDVALGGLGAAELRVQRFI